MAQQRTGSDRLGPDQTLLCAATLLGLLVVLVTIADGVPSAVIAVGLVALAVGVATLVRGRAEWLRLVGRPAGAAVLALGVATVALGGVLSPSATQPADSTAAPSAGTATAPAAPTPTTPAPRMDVTCPSPSGDSPLFGHAISAAAPYTVVIDYGDGDVYTNDDQHLGAVFSHTYPVDGAFVVTAVLTDATGQTATASCTYRW